MFKFKNYKKLYEIELNNRKIIDDRRKELSDENVNFQKMLINYEKRNKSLKEEVAMLKIQLDDTLGFLEQEKQCSEALRKERKNLKSKLTRCISTLAEYSLDKATKFNKALGKEVNNGKRS